MVTGGFNHARPLVLLDYFNKPNTSGNVEFFLQTIQTPEVFNGNTYVANANFHKPLVLGSSSFDFELIFF